MFVELSVVLESNRIKTVVICLHILKKEGNLETDFHTKCM